MTEPLKPISYLAPYMSEEAIKAAIRVLRGSHVDRGLISREFEINFAKLFTSNYAISTNSCTAALHLSLLTAGVKQGDEVISTPLTYPAPNLAILYTGAKPVFADIDPDTLNIDPASIAQRITPKTKAIMIVDFAGMPCDMEAITALSTTYRIPIIEDAAQSLGATYQGRKVGDLADFTCFSFDPYKVIPAGAGGGMILTNNLDSDAKLRRLRYYGFQLHNNPDFFDNDYYKKFTMEDVGMKYYMKEVSAAMANEHLAIFPRLLAHRRHIAEYYQKNLTRTSGLRLFPLMPLRESAYYTFPILVLQRAKFFQAMYSRGIRIGLPAVRNDIAPIFGGTRQDLRVMNELEHQYAGLPIHNKITEEDAARVIEAVKMGW